jgi:hypothetical protein
MKELGNTLAQFMAIIVITITLAVSSAAMFFWANDSSDAAPVTPAGNEQMVATFAR